MMLDDHLIAHRGWQRRFPENTLAAVDAAVDAGARAVEVDVQLSADGEPVLFHDRELWRLCRRRGRVSDYSWDELAQMAPSEPDRFGERFANLRLAHAQQLVELLSEHPQVHLFYEAKVEALTRFPPAEAMQRLLAPLAPLATRCTVISFSFALLRAARDLGWTQLGPVVRSWTQRETRAVRALRPTVIFIDRNLLPARDTLQAPAPLAVYEVDQPSEARELLQRGVRWVETFAVGEMIEADRGRG